MRRTCRNPSHKYTLFPNEVFVHTRRQLALLPLTGVTRDTRHRQNVANRQHRHHNPAKYTIRMQRQALLMLLSATSGISSREARQRPGGLQRPGALARRARLGRPGYPAGRGGPCCPWAPAALARPGDPSCPEHLLCRRAQGFPLNRAQDSSAPSSSSIFPCKARCCTADFWLNIRLPGRPRLPGEPICPGIPSLPAAPLTPSARVQSPPSSQYRQKQARACYRADRHKGRGR